MNPKTLAPINPELTMDPFSSMKSPHWPVALGRPSRTGVVLGLQEPRSALHTAIVLQVTARPMALTPTYKVLRGSSTILPLQGGKRPQRS